ncbi:MAG: hypothetical protein ISN29_11335 [Gammaproteobacteria bacterium AqS3]|nr:hypothetical protein [Gammaproteobacteria bacterium AqS3]
MDGTWVLIGLGLLGCVLGLAAFLWNRHEQRQAVRGSARRRHEPFMDEDDDQPVDSGVAEPSGQVQMRLDLDLFSSEPSEFLSLYLDLTSPHSFDDVRVQLEGLGLRHHRRHGIFYRPLALESPEYLAKFIVFDGINGKFQDEDDPNIRSLTLAMPLPMEVDPVTVFFQDLVELGLELSRRFRAPLRNIENVEIRSAESQVLRHFRDDIESFERLQRERDALAEQGDGGFDEEGSERDDLDPSEMDRPDPDAGGSPRR